jgi:tRNA-specific 2-thiouridylase
MLARLGPRLLERLWFPLGELEKPAVRDAARAASLPVAEKPESQDLCFLAGGGRDALLDRMGASGAPGPVVSIEGRVLGTHTGQHRFTVGQRRGLGVAAAEPLYVVEKDAPTGRVVVGPKSALATTRVALTGCHLHRPGAVVDSVKLRYRSAPVTCRVAGDAAAGAHARLSLELAEAVHGVAPGQVACLFAGDLVAGWGTIETKETMAHAA